MTMQWAEIEAKWQERWNRAGEFEAEPSDKPKKFITVAYPYPNSPQHIGHGRTYTLADVHARYWRMRGYNVLFPMAFHYTGTPILGMAKRIQAGEEEIVRNLREIYGVPEGMISGFSEPIRIADYFHEEIKAGMMEMGYSIDWRREFTTIDPGYGNFIRWQVSMLRDMGLIVQGSHPVGWCPNDQNPVSQHDTLGDVEPDFVEYVMVKFKLGEYTVPVATLRPETVFGVTNLWVHPDITYEKIKVDGQKWIVSKECAFKLRFLDRTVEHLGSIHSSEMVRRSAMLPHANARVPILPARFVDGRTGTGIVMSVPAHAPYDYQALADLRKGGPCAGIASAITPVSIIETEGHGLMPGVEAVDGAGIRDQDDPELERITKEVYSAEFYSGSLRTNTGRFAGTRVKYSKDPIREWLSEVNGSETLLELSDAVRCRCGTECVVKVLNNQWFLNYADQRWKESTRECMGSMSILPQELRPEFGQVVSWLRQRACARQHGMGTKVPWDEDWIVESLSDSVIYMAYYVVSKFVNDGSITPDCMTPGFFDYVLLGRGGPGEASEATGIPLDTLVRIRREFEYFYPVDSRHSGRDLIPNHLTFFVMNHVAIFPKEMWPRQIVVNGSVLMDGSKMSKSMGNIVPLRQAIRKHGADPIRLSIIASAELLQDADFSLESVYSFQGKLEDLHGQCLSIGGSAGEAAGAEAEDRWLLHRAQHMISRASAAMDKMRVREAMHAILFDMEADLAWHSKRTGAKKRPRGSRAVRHTLSLVHSARVAMLSPLAPHAAEEMWEALGRKGLASRAGWPRHVHESYAGPADGRLADSSAWPEFLQERADIRAVQSEDLLMSVMKDISRILKIARIAPAQITIYAASPLKAAAYRSILRAVMDGRTVMKDIMPRLIADPGTAGIKRDPGFVQKSIRDILSTPPDIRRARLESEGFDERAFLEEELPDLVRSEFGVGVSIAPEDGSDKACRARPFKPAILVR